MIVEEKRVIERKEGLDGLNRRRLTCNRRRESKNDIRPEP